MQYSAGSGSRVPLQKSDTSDVVATGSFSKKNLPYRDKTRLKGSQSEIPTVSVTPDIVNIGGYHKYTVHLHTQQLEVRSKPAKFQKLTEYLRDKALQDGCGTLIDIGCNSGLTTVIALKVGFHHSYCLDHDSEYIQNVRVAATALHLNPNITAEVFNFGAPFNHTADVVVAAAIIHWVYSLTADFRNFDLILDYLCKFVNPNKYLFIEWVDPRDSAIAKLGHLTLKGNRPTDVPYTTENFESAALRKGNILSKEPIDGNHRVLYVIQVKSPL